MRPAVEAGVGLRVKAAVARIRVFAGAGGAHGERLHGGGGAVVGQALDDGESRAAVRAVDEGVVEAPVAPVEQLAEAVVACGDVRGDQRGPGGVVFGGDDAEGGVTGLVDGCVVEFADLHGLDAGGRGRVVAKRDSERGDGGVGAGGLDVHAVAGVEHPAADAVRERLSVDERAHADALDDAGYMDVRTRHGGSSGAILSARPTARDRGWPGASAAGAARHVSIDGCYKSRLWSVAAQVSSPWCTPRRPRSLSASSYMRAPRPFSARISRQL